MIRKKCYLVCVFSAILALVLFNSFLSSKQTTTPPMKWSRLPGSGRKSDNDVASNELAISNEPNYLDDSDDHVFWFVQVRVCHKEAH